jgi:thioredoxin reductase (NADPH)
MLYNTLVNKQVADVLILGGGPSGLTAGIYCARAGLNTALLAGNPPGGQLMWTSEVENYPGFPVGITGPDLILAMRQQVERFGVKITDANAVKITGSFKDGFEITADSTDSFKSKTVIIATGASAKWLGLPSEQKLRGKGVSACATCDGFFFKNKVVAVVGAGDAAMEESLYLTKFVEKVYLLVRKSATDMRASKIMIERAMANPKIEFKYHTEVTEVLGDQFVTGLRVKNTETGEESVMDDVEGLFVAIGHKPNTDFLLSEGGSLIELGKFGYATPKECTHTHTTQEGIFVAGDVSDHKYRQAVTAAGFGCMAALDCIKFLSEKV